MPAKNNENNRVSAQKSRRRKEIHLESLQVRVEVLKLERAVLNARVEALGEENKRLRAQD